MARRYRTKDTIGKIGADAFRSWAGAAGLVVNESGDDQAGWDFIVESNPEAGTEATPDPFRHADSFPLRARVQVKATDASKGFIDVKLSNWVRLVESPDPAFFFVAELDGQDTPQRVWLHHVDARDWRDVQERKWANEVGAGAKARRALHKLSLRLRYDDRPPLDAHGAAALLTALADAIGPSLSDYSSRKLEAVSTVGYERGNVRIDLGFDESPECSLAEAELRLRPSVHVPRFRVAPARFGTEHEGRAQVVEGASMFVQSPAPERPVTLVVEAPGGPVRIPATLHVPTAVSTRATQGLPLTGLPVRVTAPVLDIVGRFGEPSTVTVTSPEPHQRVPVRQLRALNALTRAMVAQACGAAPLAVRVLGEEGGALEFRGDPASPPPDRTPDGFPPDWVLDAVDRAWELAKRFEVEDALDLSLDEAVTLEAAIAQALALADGTADGTLRFQWNPTGPSDPACLTDISADVILTCRFTIANVVLGIAAYLGGAMAPPESDAYTLVFDGTDHVATDARLATEPEADLFLVARRSLGLLGRQALVQVFTEDQTQIYSPTAEAPAADLE
ncbi:hypothetical protein RQM47_16550 [Rubrivirga sp. S365]|uniref:hypothetical protein n=1 Tax=Rubrivirga sp. S365 TaxID=3076080 RepID=UPI0028C917C4|nr:hypothetical protein [Rubrivirga sp. S365]MDT7858261.1 hypothetical protein [Rubrivirga sp. S365]